MKETTFKREVYIDFIQMSALFLGSVISVYKAGPTIRDLYFLIPLALAFKSKKDYFWFAYFFILISAPNGLFANRTQAAMFRLPFYGVSSFSFTPMDVFLLMSIFKAFQVNKRVKFFLNKPLEFFFFYLLLVSIPISFVLGTELKPFVNTLRSFFFYGIIFSYLRLVKDKEEVLKFGYLLLPYSFLVIFDQLYLVKTGNRFISLLDPSMLGLFARNSMTGGVRAMVQGILIVYYTLIFGYQIYNNKKYEVIPGISIVAILLPNAIFILSATRSWMTIGFITIFAFMAMSSKGLKLAVQAGTIGVLMFIALLSTGVMDMEFLDSIYQRYAVVGDVARSGSLQNADTFNNRIEQDIPKVLKGVAFSPVLGVGMSQHIKTYYSDDLGFMNTILIYGFLGFPIFLFFLFRYLFQCNRLRKHSAYDLTDKNIFMSLILGILGMMAGYFFTWDFFSFFPEKVFFVSIVFATGDLIINFQEREADAKYYAVQT
ncbi:MAG: hypothetical protein U0W24_24455 [Bacteroidales bacterium]